MISKTFRRLSSLLIGIATLAPVLAIASECGGESRCVFVLGNSITRHGPASEIGWAGDWGMAASSPEKDYVSQLLKLLSEKSKSEAWMADRLSSGMLEKNPEKFKLTLSSIQQSKKADVVIVAVGDNFIPDVANVDLFSKTYLETLNTLRPLKGVLACVGTWWTSPLKNKIIKKNCSVAGGIYVDISGLSDSPENVAGNQQNIAHKGVATHPGDRGMKAIAERIYKLIPHADRTEKMSQGRDTIR